MTDIAWIGIEESTTAARGWGFDGAGTPRAEARADDAAGVVADLPDAPALVISDRAAPGARPVPARVLPEHGPLAPLSQASPPALLPVTACLRLAGALVARPHWDGVCVLPMADATHWIHVSAGEVVSIVSFLTPRLARMLEAMPERASTAASGDTMARPERLAAQLAQAELTGDAAAVLGHLLGAELAAARPYWLGQGIVLIGEGALADSYGDILTAQGAVPERMNTTGTAQAGLAALRAR